MFRLNSLVMFDGAAIDDAVDAGKKKVNITNPKLDIALMFDDCGSMRRTLNGKGCTIECVNEFTWLYI